MCVSAVSVNPASDLNEECRISRQEKLWFIHFKICFDKAMKRRGPHSPLYNEYRVFPGGKERPRLDADPSPPSSAVVMKE